MSEKLTLIKSRDIAERLVSFFDENRMYEFWRLIDERLLHYKVAERYLEAVEEVLRRRSIEDPDKWLMICDEIADRQTDSAYHLSSLILGGILTQRMKECFDHSRIYLSDTTRWFSSDVYAVHVVCRGLKHDFTNAIRYLYEFANDSSVWVKRCVGIAVHHYAKSVRDMPERIAVILDLMKRLIGEKDVRVAKGIGWGLRSIGEFYPDLLVKFAKRNFARKKVSKLLFRVAVANLSFDAKEELLKQWSDT